AGRDRQRDRRRPRRRGERAPHAREPDLEARGGEGRGKPRPYIQGGGVLTQDVLVERLPDRPVARLTLNRPDKRNTITWEMRQVIGDSIGELGRDRSVRVILVTGSGGYFSSGGDMRGFLEREPYEFAHLGENMAAVEEVP